MSHVSFMRSQEPRVFPPGACMAAAGETQRVSELAYRVELWDESRSRVERVLATADSAGLAFAAYYAALRGLPGRFVTLRHNGQIISTRKNSHAG